MTKQIVSWETVKGMKGTLIEGPPDSEYHYFVQTHGRQQIDPPTYLIPKKSLKEFFEGIYKQKE